MLFGRIEVTGLLVKSSQGILHVHVARIHFGEILIGRNRLRRVVHDVGVVSLDEILFLSGQAVAQFDGPPRRLLSLIVVAQVGVNLCELRISKCEIRIVAGGGF